MLKAIYRTANYNQSVLDKIINYSTNEFSGEYIAIVEMTETGNNVHFIYEGSCNSSVTNIPSIEDYAVEYYHSMVYGLESLYGYIFTPYDALISNFNELLKESSMETKDISKTLDKLFCILW